MLHTTPGIVLHSFKYSDTSLIAKVLTRNFGVQSYLIHGVYKSKSRFRASLFQPLTLLELVAYHKDNQGLQHIKEVRCSHPLTQIATDVRKSSVAIFMAEVLMNIFKHQEPQPQLFDFITRSAILLDILEENTGVFHVLFCMQLTRYAGFAPSFNYSTTQCYFHLREGKYLLEQDKDDYCLDPETSLYFYHLSLKGFDDLPGIKLNATIRKKITRHIIEYFRFHLDGFSEIKSLDVLEAVFE